MKMKMTGLLGAYSTIIFNSITVRGDTWVEYLNLWGSNGATKCTEGVYCSKLPGIEAHISLKIVQKHADSDSAFWNILYLLHFASILPKAFIQWYFETRSSHNKYNEWMRFCELINLAAPLYTLQDKTIHWNQCS